ncbi:MAG: tRNA1(Val) (adenine(37)-N6)-methyltransferase [Candidatus Aminicenantales bacterium]
MKGEDETLDSFYHGKILVLQKKRGYRFSVDSPLLADFIQTKGSEELLELGAGCGIISLLLSIKPFRHITAVEIQESLADLASRNVLLNRLEERITIVHQDLRSFNPSKKFDVVFSNPPYIKGKRGRLSLLEEKSIAKHEVKCDIFDIMAKTAELLKEKGRAYFIFPARREEDFRLALQRNHLKMKTIRFVFPRRNTPPNFFLSECDFKSRKDTLLAPLVLFDKAGEYTSEAKEIFQGRKHAAYSQ